MIIVQAISAIRVFFVVFAAGILAFTIAIMHLLRGCASSSCQTPATSFPDQFYEAISATYFFMSGRYDSVSDDFNSDNWAFHFMMIVYFLFTVIIMLNVLIALINVAFNKDDETWLLVWRKNRLHYIESAERLSHRIPDEITVTGSQKKFTTQPSQNKSERTEKNIPRKWRTGTLILRMDLRTYLTIFLQRRLLLLILRLPRHQLMYHRRQTRIRRHLQRLKLPRTQYRP
ncbi:hypothetical protein BC939DRAFT_226802 [Gamsiella multidivaricata]|uniref:uncharacterized protein n=1 Tax=Gamsiella multidivaricata TaxID=101098 RepID=UPI00221EADA6|nr:uncharacterized protein BC939DRAFT_226802 [Gamsiella multidivaricata]KAI7831329.1 hypothetical protein BC939DRAFT_226802 [Gamsiella multidivaricata]